MTESMIRNQVANYLKSIGFYVMRINSGKYQVGEGRSRRFIMGAEKGTPDLMGFSGHPQTGVLRIIFVEVKKPGEKATLVQKMKMKELAEFGAQCYVVHGWEEMRDLL